MSSSLPTLTDVLYYTSTDAYNYLTDNRPIYQLDDNIRSVASALVGLGYGEHTSVNGGLLTPGKGVELLANGQIRYPLDNISPKVMGIVIGTSAAGLIKVIWGSTHLDLEVVGLSNILVGAAPDAYIVTAIDGTGTLSTKSPITLSDVVVGKVKQLPYISIGLDSSAVASTDPTPAANAHNFYGLTRMRNLILLDALESSPVQFTKITHRQSDIGLSVGSTINPLNISFNTSSQIISAPTTSTTAYVGYDLSSAGKWTIKETYTRFPNNGVTNNIVSFQNSLGITGSNWQTIAYTPALSYGGNANAYSNYDLEQLNGGFSYSNTDVFQQFLISKYYSYSVVSSSSAAYGKPTAIVTVFDPQSQGLGGEPAIFIVCDFIQYNLSTGLEIRKDRVILTGASATNLYSDTNVFTNNITTI